MIKQNFLLPVPAIIHPLPAATDPGGRGRSGWRLRSTFPLLSSTLHHLHPLPSHQRRKLRSEHHLACLPSPSPSTPQRSRQSLNLYPHPNVVLIKTFSEFGRLNLATCSSAPPVRRWAGGQDADGRRKGKTGPKDTPSPSLFSPPTNTHTVLLRTCRMRVRARCTVGHVCARMQRTRRRPSKRSGSPDNKRVHGSVRPPLPCRTCDGTSVWVDGVGDRGGRKGGNTG